MADGAYEMRRDLSYLAQMTWIPEKEAAAILDWPRERLHEWLKDWRHARWHIPELGTCYSLELICQLLRDEPGEDDRIARLYGWQSAEELDEAIERDLDASCEAMARDNGFVSFDEFVEHEIAQSKKDCDHFAKIDAQSMLCTWCKEYCGP